MLTATTKIDAINLVLASVGDSPVNTLEENDNVDVANALRLLDSASKAIQRQGWNYNTYENYVLKPDTQTKKIRYNPHFIHFEALDGNTYAVRSGYLYDMANQTDRFTQDVTLRVIVAVDFEDLPQVFKEYVTYRTAVSFQQRYMGDEGMSQYLLMELKEAQEALSEYDLNMKPVNMLNIPGIAEKRQRT